MPTIWSSPSTRWLQRSLTVSEVFWIPPNLTSLNPEVLKELCEACKPGESVRDMCIKGDVRMVEETSKAFKKDKKLIKGWF